MKRFGRLPLEIFYIATAIDRRRFYAERFFAIRTRPDREQIKTDSRARLNLWTRKPPQATNYKLNWVSLTHSLAVRVDTTADISKNSQFSLFSCQVEQRIRQSVYLSNAIANWISLSVTLKM